MAENEYASVAQLDRVSPSDGEGCGFDSRRVHHMKRPKSLNPMSRNSSGVCAFYYGFLDFYSIFDIVLRILTECRFCKKRKINSQIVKNSIEQFSINLIPINLLKISGIYLIH